MDTWTPPNHIYMENLAFSNLNISEISRRTKIPRSTLIRWKQVGRIEIELKEKGYDLSALLHDIKAPGALRVDMETGEILNSDNLVVDHEVTAEDVPPTAGKVEDTSPDALNKGNEKKPDSYIQKAMKELGKEFPWILEEARPVEFIPTGFEELDKILGGGLVKGRLIEIFGVESAGKTSLSTQIAANWLAKGKRIAYLDFEHAVDLTYAEALGLPKNEILFFQPSIMEDGMDILRSLCQRGGLDLIIVDSVASMCTRAEIEGESGAATIGLKARYMSQLIRLITPDCDKKGITVIFINQIRKNIGMYVPPETTPGGLALRYGCTQRIELRLASSKDKSEGREVNITCVKNKAANPYGKVTMNLEYGKGFQS